MASVKRSLRFAFTMAMVVALVAMTAGVATAAGPNGYDSIPKNLPGNVPSQAFQATQTSEFGDSVTLGGEKRKADSVEVVMSSWGCESGTWNGGDCATAHNAKFMHPITLNLYNVNGLTGEPDGLVLTQTQTFAIPYRPSADPVKCTGADAGKWYSKSDKTCYNGFATKIKFNLDDQVLPTNVIWAIAFNTSGYGAAPIGYATPCATSTAGCAYDSLNVGAQSFDGEPSKGTDADPAGAVLDSDTPAQYCDGGVTGFGFLNRDDGCWSGFTPLATIKTK